MSLRFTVNWGASRSGPLQSLETLYQCTDISLNMQHFKLFFIPSHHFIFSSTSCLPVDTPMQLCFLFFSLLNWNIWWTLTRLYMLCVSVKATRQRTRCRQQFVRKSAPHLDQCQRAPRRLRPQVNRLRSQCYTSHGDMWWGHCRGIKGTTRPVYNTIQSINDYGKLRAGDCHLMSVGKDVCFYNHATPLPSSPDKNESLLKS